jgi:multiple sugar transport system substrate-binding protein
MPVSGWWVAVWNRSPHQQEAARFVDYMVSRDGVRLWSTVGGQVPTRRSVLEDPFFAQPQNAWVQTMVQAWQTRSWIEPTECNTRTLQAILNEATHQVVLSNTDPMAALRAAEARFTEAQ